LEVGGEGDVVTDVAAVPEGRTAEIAGTQLFYLDEGSGEPVLFLHGGGPGASGWSNFSRNIGPLAEHFRVIVPDLPGFGRSSSVADLTNPFAAYATVLVGLLDRLGIEKVNLVGNSMGGGTSLRMAMDHAARVRRLVLLGSMGFEPSFTTPEPTDGVRTLVGYYQDATPERMRQLLEMFAWDPSMVTDELVRERYEYSVAPQNIAAMRSLYDALARPEVRRSLDLAGELHRVACETLVIWGRDDRVVPLDSGLGMLKRLGDARMLIFGRCGHWAQSEHPGEFNTAVANFLQRP
jgi:pimeloyl-ACP methyl ester carboxylesterase